MTSVTPVLSEMKPIHTLPISLRYIYCYLPIYFRFFKAVFFLSGCRTKSFKFLFVSLLRSTCLTHNFLLDVTF